MTVRVVLAEDQSMVLGAFASLLELERDVEVVATASDGRAALAAVAAHRPDVLLADIEMPGMTGLDVAAELQRRGDRTRVLIVTTFARSGYRAASLATEVEHARVALAAVGVATEVEGVDVDVTPSVETALALALREAVTNVVRHAAATTCHIRVVRDGDELRLEVTDDGRGGGAEGNGLRGMRERITALGGRVERATSRGTTVTVAVPAQVAG